MKVLFLSITMLFSCVLMPLVAQPNIIVIMTDDQGYADAGCYDSQDLKTPHIDTLAESGIRFTAGYVTHPYCSPSRAGFLSGKYQQSFGHEHNPRYDENNNEMGIDKDTLLFPSYLKEAGYTSAIFGKWHLGAGEPFRPLTRGFDHFWGFLGGGHDYYKTNPKAKGYNGPVWIDKGPSDVKLTYATDDLTRETIRFINENKEKPFFAFVSYTAPHYPNQAKPEDIARFSNIRHKGRRIYAAMMACVDDNVGKIVSTLKDLKLRDNTIIYYLSDNGGRRELADSRPFRGNKGWLYEGGVRVPFIISYPSHLPAGKVYTNPISSLDILPTSLAAADIKTDTKLDGVNLLPYLTGEKQGTPHQLLHWRTSGGQGFALQQGDWKVIQDVYHEKPELYHLSQDQEERTDLSKQYPEKLNSILTNHQTWNSTLQKPRWDEGHTKGTRDEWNSAKSNGYRVWGRTWHLENK